MPSSYRSYTLRTFVTFFFLFCLPFLALFLVNDVSILIRFSDSIVAGWPSRRLQAAGSIGSGLYVWGIGRAEARAATRIEVGPGRFIVSVETCRLGGPGGGGKRRRVRWVERTLS